MALETVVYPQDSFGYSCGGAGGGGWGYEYVLQQENQSFARISEQAVNGNWDSSSSSAMQNVKEWDPNSSPETCTIGEQWCPMTESPPDKISGRRKRRRVKSGKNKEEMENQRMTHIAVERNRRKQMNEYLAAIRSLMPASYVQRGDQASIIGGAINFVKELEQHLQTIEARKRSTQQPNTGLPPVFTEFFTYPQYSTRSNSSLGSATENKSAFGDIEVTMVESHANLKILSKRTPKQLLKIVAGLQCLWLTILHLNVTTLDQMVLYTLSVKLEEGCQLTTVEEIADVVNHLLRRIQEEGDLS